MAEAFSAGMRVDRADRCQKDGLVLRVDVTRDASRIVQVWWRVGPVGSVEWVDPEVLTTHRSGVER